MHGAPFTDTGILTYGAAMAAIGIVAACLVGRDGQHLKFFWSVVGIAGVVIFAGTESAIGLGAIPLAVMSLPVNAILIGTPWAITRYFITLRGAKSDREVR